jgi:hypothetical protein
LFFFGAGFRFGGYMAKAEKGTNIHWHPAFLEVLKLDLNDYLDEIEILAEFPLTTEPLRIDCVVIKKTKNLHIKKKFAEIFRGWNILEYKNPRDHVSVNDFHKVYAYACLYSVLMNVPVDNISISLIESRYPKKLIDFLEKVRKYTVEKNGTGIYTIKGDVFAMQIIDSRHLSDSENLWLKSLSGEYDQNAIDRMFIEFRKKDPRINFEVILDVMSRADPKKFKELTYMKTPLFVDIILDSEAGRNRINEYEAKAEEKGEAKGKAEVARSLKTGGMSYDLISQYTGLSAAEIQNL